MIKLSQGEKVPMEKVETLIRNSKYVNQAIVYGDSTRRNMVGFIVPDISKLEEYAQENNIKYNDPEELLEHSGIEKLFSEELENNSEELKGFEKVKKFKLLKEEFTPENGLLTPTLKMKRPKIYEKYAEMIKEMYES